MIIKKTFLSSYKGLKLYISEESNYIKRVSIITDSNELDISLDSDVCDYLSRSFSEIGNKLSKKEIV